MDEKEGQKSDDENSKISLAEQIDRLEKANQEKKALLEREEQLEARRRLGGQTDAGIQPPAVKEETPQEYYKKISSGQLNKKK